MSSNAPHAGYLLRKDVKSVHAVDVDKPTSLRETRTGLRLVATSVCDREIEVRDQQVFDVDGPPANACKRCVAGLAA